MVELTASQIADLLRKCSGSIVCDGCPLHAEHPRCVRTLMQSAAEALDGHEAKIAQLREIIAKHKIK